MRHVPDLGHGALGRFRYALGSIDETGQAHHETEDVPVEVCGPSGRIELRPHHGELVKRGHQPVAEGCHPDIAEDGDDHQEKWIDGDEPVPAQGDDVVVGSVVPELLHHAVAHGSRPVPTLPAVDTGQHALHRPHHLRPRRMLTSEPEAGSPPVSSAMVTSIGPMPERAPTAGRAPGRTG